MHTQKKYDAHQNITNSVQLGESGLIKRRWLMLIGLLSLYVNGMPALAEERLFLNHQVCQQAEVICLAPGRALIKELADAPRRVLLSSPEVADFKLLPGNQLYLLGKANGTTDLIIWNKNYQKQYFRLMTVVDLVPLNDALKALYPEESGVTTAITPAAVILNGEVSNTLVAEAIQSVANAFVAEVNLHASMEGGANGRNNSANTQSNPANSNPNPTLDTATASQPATNGQFQLINLMRVRDPQQVILDVRIAEVSKDVTENLGVGLGGGKSRGDFGWSIVSGFSGGAEGVLNLLFNQTGNTIANVDIDAEKEDALIKILAQPSIVAMSGQEGSFLVGGKIFIPVNTVQQGFSIIQLQKEDFGIGLKFIPTVLDKGRLNLKVYTEVSEVARDPLVFESGSTRSVIPAINSRNVSTTVQLNQGDSLVIGGLLKNNIIESIRAFPILGELPILGALFRSTKFRSEETELLIVVSPRLVQPTKDAVVLPTDHFTPPSRTDLFLKGKLEGDAEGPHDE
jgi:pilus assembly protein CpaC